MFALLLLLLLLLSINIVAVLAYIMSLYCQMCMTRGPRCAC